MSDLDHPCKNYCSGWKQGFEAGRAESDTKLKEIWEELCRAKETVEWKTIDRYREEHDKWCLWKGNEAENAKLREELDVYQKRHFDATEEVRQREEEVARLTKECELRSHDRVALLESQEREARLRAALVLAKKFHDDLFIKGNVPWGQTCGLDFKLMNEALLATTNAIESTPEPRLTGVVRGLRGALTHAVPGSCEFNDDGCKKCMALADAEPVLREMGVI